MLLFFWMGRWALCSPWKRGLAAALSWAVGAARGAHLLKAIALLVHVIPLCPSPKGETRSWRVCREGHVCVGCCSLVLFLSPFSHAPWIHFLGGSEVSRGGWCGREHFRAKTFCTYRPFPLFFFFKSALFQTWYHSSIHISLRACQNLKGSWAREGFSVSAEPVLSTCDRRRQEGKGKSSPHWPPQVPCYPSRSCGCAGLGS